MSEEIQRIADELFHVHVHGGAIDPVRERLPANDVAAAYAVQDVNTRRWVAEGRRIVGRKIGLTSLAVQKQLGVDQPDFGMLFADMAYADGEDVPWSRLHQPKCEAEVALVLEHDLDREGLTVADVIRATAFALPAIEIVGSRIALFAYPNGRPGADYRADAVAVVRDLGFDAAVSTAWGVSRRDSDVFQLPRFTPWDRSRTRFGLRLLRNMAAAPQPAPLAA